MNYLRNEQANLTGSSVFYFFIHKKLIIQQIEYQIKD